MATYLTPGVYIEEDLTPRTGNGYGDARAIACFVGIAAKGPAVPTLITSWTQFNNIYGGFTASQSLLPYAVDQFFKNGGGRCTIIRAVRSDAVAAFVNLVDSTPAGAPNNGPLPALKVTALAPGLGGNSLKAQVVPTGVPGRFNLRVLEGTQQLEIFEDLSVNPTDARYVTAIVNSPFAGSRLIKLSNLKVTESYVYNATNDVLPAQTANLGSGVDGVQPYDYINSTKQLADSDDNYDINLPGITAASTLNPLIEWADERGKAMLVIDGPRALEGSTSAQVLAGYTGMITGGSAIVASSHGAIYAPWIMVPDTSSSLYGAVRLIPPGGAVLGKYSRNDVVRHVGKAPAGVETRLDTALATETKFTATQLDEANDSHINIIRNVPGHGICIMGSRTLKRTHPDHYVPIRRTLMMLTKQLTDISRFAIFEPNGPDLWTQLELVIGKFLGTIARAGVLAGATESEAFQVRCDADLNPPASIRAGYVNIEVAVALRYPAEFIVIKLGQYDGGTDISFS
ncbi:phage tail sheath family protein [Herbidospora galbida]|uniref:Phage tail sheath family protein n=1 Tax=Herbidospora galbida TaxID=2575442 RepID=A0A4U3M6X8_9ACTN|nr:phage tail sheath subtilisin-like domain-containing protein [Herbidospora galbida]TKK84698.1 phage tail sheath family protein [Herbidospora galbida]